MGWITIPCQPPDLANTKTKDIEEGKYYEVENETDYTTFWKACSMEPLLPYFIRVHHHEEDGLCHIRSSHFIPNVPPPTQFP